MKTLILNITLLLTTLSCFAGIRQMNMDSIKLLSDGNHTYYQQVVKADSVPEGVMYGRIVQFMAAKNITQNYGYQEEGRMIFTTTQDLNINPVYVGDDSDIVQPYTVQFSITLDLKNGSYRYTISNVTFYLPTGTGNKRESLNEVYIKQNNIESRRVAREAKKLIDSFERYLSSLLKELHEEIKHQSVTSNTQF